MFWPEGRFVGLFAARLKKTYEGPSKTFSGAGENRLSSVAVVRRCRDLMQNRNKVLSKITGHYTRQRNHQPLDY